MLSLTPRTDSCTSLQADPFGHRGSCRSSAGTGWGILFLGTPGRGWGHAWVAGWHGDGGYGIHRPMGGQLSKGFCGAWGDHCLPATLTGWLKTQAQGGLRLTEAVSGEGRMAPVSTCSGGAVKIISANKHVLRHVSSSPGPLFPQQLKGGWTRAKEAWEQQGQAGLCVGLRKES